MTHGP
jgi:hypothetical protein